MRRQLVRLHRWFGVATALFLFVAGLTGAIIAWDHELDAALNPSFYQARTAGPANSTAWPAPKPAPTWAINANAMSLAVTAGASRCFVISSR